MDELFIIPYGEKSFEVLNNKHQNWLMLLQEHASLGLFRRKNVINTYSVYFLLLNVQGEIKG